MPLLYFHGVTLTVACFTLFHYHRHRRNRLEQFGAKVVPLSTSLSYDKNRVALIKHVNKIQIWNLVQYSKIVFIDLDMTLHAKLGTCRNIGSSCVVFAVLTFAVGRFPLRLSRRTAYVSQQSRESVSFQFRLDFSDLYCRSNELTFNALRRNNHRFAKRKSLSKDGENVALVSFGLGLHRSSIVRIDVFLRKIGGCIFVLRLFCFRR